MRGAKQYLGRAGQLFVVSEFLLRNWNAAIPEVDVGDDVFVVRDKIGEFKRIQVKTINASTKKHGCSAKFILPLNQLRTNIQPELVYFLVVRFDDEWFDYMIFERAKLNDLVEINGLGTVNEKNNNFQVTFQFLNSEIVKASNIDCSKNRQDWTMFPNEESKDKDEDSEQG
jgi:hypothetical protein